MKVDLEIGASETGFSANVIKDGKLVFTYTSSGIGNSMIIKSCRDFRYYPELLTEAEFEKVHNHLTVLSNYHFGYRNFWL